MTKSVIYGTEELIVQSEIRAHYIPVHTHGLILMHQQMFYYLVFIQIVLRYQIYQYNMNIRMV